MTDKEYRITTRLAHLQTASDAVGRVISKMLEGPDRVKMRTALDIINAQRTHDEQNLKEMLQ